MQGWGLESCPLLPPPPPSPLHVISIISTDLGLSPGYLIYKGKGRIEMREGGQCADI